MHARKRAAIQVLMNEDIVANRPTTSAAPSAKARREKTERELARWQDKALRKEATREVMRVLDTCRVSNREALELIGLSPESQGQIAGFRKGERIVGAGGPARATPSVVCPRHLRPAPGPSGMEVKRCAPGGRRGRRRCLTAPMTAGIL